MKLEAGKFYRARNGSKVGPAIRREPSDYEKGRDWIVGGCAYHSDGTPFGRKDAEPWALDLVAEWTDEATGPVVTETVKRIKPGIYGKLNVTGTYQKNRVTLDWVTDDFHSAPPIVGLSAEECRAVAAHLNAIADALEQTP